MPSKNSVNKPKANMTRQRKSLTAVKKRQQRARKAVTTIKNAKGSTDIVALSSSRGGGVLVNTLISKKKAKKLERNIKYANARDKVSKKKSSGDDEIEIDTEAESEGNVYRAALWSLVESVKANGVPVAAAVGEGTTLGGPVF